MKLDAGNAKRTTWHSISAYPTPHMKMNGHVHNTFATQEEIKDSKDDMEKIRGRGREKMLKKWDIHPISTLLMSIMVEILPKNITNWKNNYALRGTHCS